MVTARSSRLGGCPSSELLERRLTLGARVVSRNFTMGSWLPGASEILEEAPWGCDTLYLWRVGEALRPAAGADDPERNRAERPTA
jgi:hypothetical protein